MVLGWIGWTEEKGFKDVEGIEERFKCCLFLRKYLIPRWFWAG